MKQFDKLYNQIVEADLGQAMELKPVKVDVLDVMGLYNVLVAAKKQMGNKFSSDLDKILKQLEQAMK